MNISDRHVRPKVDLLTDMDARKLISPAINRACMDHGVERLALKTGVDEKTIRRARECETTLKLASALNLLASDPNALDLALAHFGLMVVPLPTHDTDTMVEVATLSADIARAKHPNSPGGASITAGEVRNMNLDRAVSTMMALKGAASETQCRDLRAVA